MNPEKIQQLTESVYRTLENLQQYCRSNEFQSRFGTPYGCDPQTQFSGSWTPWVGRSYTGYGFYPYGSVGSYTGNSFPWGQGSQFWTVPGFNPSFGTCVPNGCFPTTQNFTSGFGTGNYPTTPWGTGFQNTGSWGNWNPWFFGNSTSFPTGNWFGGVGTPWTGSQMNPTGWYPTNWNGQNFQGQGMNQQPTTPFGTTHTPQNPICDTPHCA